MTRKIRTEDIENLTTADVAASTDKNYITDAQQTVIGNTSGTNTGDQTSVSGNAGSATVLETARTFRVNLASNTAVSFDGSANITPGVTNRLSVNNGGTGEASFADAGLATYTGTETFTNKTATSTTNNIAAKSLHSATTVVNVSSATAPTAGQVLTATSSTAATWQTSSSSSVKTLAPGLPVPWSIAATANTAFNSNTTAHWALLYFPTEIEVNKISFLTRADAIGTASTFDIAVYSEDGQTQLIAVTTASIAAGDTMYSTAVSSATLPAGNYYVGVIANTNGFDGRFSQGLTPLVFDDYLDVSSEPVLVGTSTETAGTLPSTINPVTEITVATSVNNSIFLLRFDN